MMAHNYFDVYCRPPKPDTRWETSTNMGSVGRLVDHVKFVVFLKKGILCRIRLTVATPKHPALAFFFYPPQWLSYQSTRNSHASLIPRQSPVGGKIKRNLQTPNAGWHEAPGVCFFLPISTSIALIQIVSSSLLSFSWWLNHLKLSQSLIIIHILNQTGCLRTAHIP
jgi:hypothetical protein